MADEFSYGERVPNPDSTHLPGCELQPLHRHPVHGGTESDPVYICVCAEGCSHVTASIQRGRELAAVYGWGAADAEGDESAPGDRGIGNCGIRETSLPRTTDESTQKQGSGDG